MSFKSSPGSVLRGGEGGLDLWVPLPCGLTLCLMVQPSSLPLSSPSALGLGPLCPAGDPGPGLSSGLQVAHEGSLGSTRPPSLLWADPLPPRPPCWGACRRRLRPPLSRLGPLAQPVHWDHCSSPALGLRVSSWSGSPPSTLHPASGSRWPVGHVSVPFSSCSGLLHKPRDLTRFLTTSSIVPCVPRSGPPPRALSPFQGHVLKVYASIPGLCPQSRVMSSVQSQSPFQGHVPSPGLIQPFRKLSPFQPPPPVCDLFRGHGSVPRSRLWFESFCLARPWKSALFDSSSQGMADLCLDCRPELESPSSERSAGPARGSVYSRASAAEGPACGIPCR